MTDPTPEEIRASIVPKSDQLNVDDLVTGPVTVKITAVRRGDREQPIVIELEGHPCRPYKPCKTMRRVLIAAYSDDPKMWVGKLMTLYVDPEVTWGGVKVGGIRISHLSGLDEPKTYLLTKARGKRSEVTIYPIDQDEEQYIASVALVIGACETREELNALGADIKTKSKAVQDRLRPLYAERLEQLTSDQGD